MTKSGSARKLFNSVVSRLEFQVWEVRVLALTAFLASLSAVILLLLALLPSTSRSTYSESWKVTGGEAFVLGELPEICDALQPGGTLTVSITSKWSPSDGYPNLFQTAQGNSGIRFEMSPAADQAALLVSAPVPETFVVFAVEPLNSETLEVVYVIQDGSSAEIRTADSISRLDDLVLNPSCSELAIGVGYDLSRVWHDEADLSIESRRNATWGLPMAFQNAGAKSLMVLVAVLCGSFVLLTLGMAWFGAIGRRTAMGDSSCLDGEI